MTEGGATWVFHRGALGDSVLLWPMLRALRWRGPVTLVADASIGRLARRWLSVEAVDGEQMRFTRLWFDHPRIDVIEGDARVICMGPASGAPVEQWTRNAAAMFPGARVTLVRRRVDRRLALRWTARGPAPEARADPSGPVVLHVGAGSEAKRWPLQRWLELADLLQARRRAVRLIAGEVELERLCVQERDAFSSAGGVYLLDLGELSCALGAASALVCADSGPAHLGAQIGLPTVALFGPTNPAHWAPVGPRVAVVAPPSPAPMTWLDPRRALAALEDVEAGAPS